MENTTPTGEQLMDVHGNFHCANDYEYHDVKDRLQSGVEALEGIRDGLDGDVPEAAVSDVETLTEVAREVAEGDRPLRDAQKVADVIEFGLAWYTDEPAECPGYAPECKSEADELGLDVPVADL